MLVELGKTDLAVELALANNVSPAFAIASQLDRMKKELAEERKKVAKARGKGKGDGKSPDG